MERIATRRIKCNKPVQSENEELEVAFNGMRHQKDSESIEKRVEKRLIRRLENDKVGIGLVYIYGNQIK